LFSAAIQSGYTWLVVLAVLGSAISAVYYFKPIIAMYMKKGEWEAVTVRLSYRIHIILIGLLIIVLGLIPSVLLVL
jgi:NADH-quinone oxidoreductase subunit N